MSNHEKHGEPTYRLYGICRSLPRKKRNLTIYQPFIYVSFSFSLKWNDVRCQCERYKDTVNEMVAGNAKGFVSAYKEEYTLAGIYVGYIRRSQIFSFNQSPTPNAT